jgi:hypothetical protein
MLMPVAFSSDPDQPGIELRFPSGRVVRIGGERGLLEDYLRVAQLLQATGRDPPLPATTITIAERKQSLSRASVFLGSLWVSWLALLFLGAWTWRDAGTWVMLALLALMTSVQVYVALTLDKKSDARRGRR